MTDRIRIGPPGLGPVTPPPGRTAAAPGSLPEQGRFRDTLQQALQPAAPPLRISAHAQDRLRQRPLSAGDMARVAAAVEQAARKGARDSLVLLRDVALVVSVQNRTVITAVSGERMKENVFTQIDSAVILSD